MRPLSQKLVLRRLIQHRIHNLGSGTALPEPNGLLQELAGHDNALDLVGAFVDLGVVGPSRLSSGLMFVIACLTSRRTDGWR